MASRYLLLPYSVNDGLLLLSTNLHTAGLLTTEN